VGNGWVAFGDVIALEVRRLTKVSDTLVASSQLLGETGVVLGSLRDVPIVGENVTDLEQEVESAAATAARPVNTPRAARPPAASRSAQASASCSFLRSSVASPSLPSHPPARHRGGNARVTVS
jgi:hypothetical protein